MRGLCGLSQSLSVIRSLKNFELFFSRLPVNSRYIRFLLLIIESQKRVQWRIYRFCPVKNIDNTVKSLIVTHWCRLKACLGGGSSNEIYQSSAVLVVFFLKKKVFISAPYFQKILALFSIRDAMVIVC